MASNPGCRQMYKPMDARAGNNFVNSTNPNKCVNDMRELLRGTGVTSSQSYRPGRMEAGTMSKETLSFNNVPVDKAMLRAHQEKMAEIAAEKTKKENEQEAARAVGGWREAEPETLGDEPAAPLSSGAMTSTCKGQEASMAQKQKQGKKRAADDGAAEPSDGAQGAPWTQAALDERHCAAGPTRL
eukprot:gene20868-24833_t